VFRRLADGVQRNVADQVMTDDQRLDD
jgi:hypothetical protein